MMDLRELRIGNLVAIDGQTRKVIGIPVAGVFYKDDNGVGTICCVIGDDVGEFIGGPSPIPITPEWLERLGFERHYKNQNIIHWVKHSQHHLAFVMTEISSLFGIEYKAHGTEHMNQVLHIHQLQNLYHALTGQELTVKELT